MMLSQLLKFSAPAIAVCAGFFAVSAHAVLPQAEFACQVVTTGGSPGLVLMQAEDKAEAIAEARTSRAYLTPQLWGEVAEVVECINPKEQRFKDASFQEFYQGVPR